jgi:6-phospho-beta-glucosidase
LKISIVGASSFSTPSLFDLDPPLDGSRFQFAFVGRDRRRLAAIKRASTVVARSRNYEPEIETFTLSDLDAALTGAAVVLIQVRIGGHAARCWDETFPHRYSLCGDEGLGAGGLAAAWRTWPELSRILGTVAAIAPGALTVIMTAPLGTLVRCALTAFPQLRVFGICELPCTTLSELCRRSASSSEDARFDYVGINHIGWFTNVTVGGRALVTSDAPLPLKYVRLHTNAAQALIEQRLKQPRGRDLEQLAGEAFPIFEAGDAEAVLTMLRRRPAPWYSEAVGPLFNALGGADDGRWYFLTSRNEGYLRSVPREAVIEIPHKRAGGAFIPASLPARPPPHLEQILAAFVGYEQLAADAVLRRSTTGLSRAVLAHPWIGRAGMSPRLVADIVAPAPRAVGRAGDVA